MSDYVAIFLGNLLGRAVASVVERHELGQPLLMVAAFGVSLICHYVWLFNYFYRGIKLGGTLKRFPNPLEIATFAINITLTVASFLEICRRMFGCRRFQFLAVWVAALYVVYGGVVLLLHLFWAEAKTAVNRLMEWARNPDAMFRAIAAAASAEEGPTSTTTLAPSADRR